jgi:hypothetical protein
MILLLILVVEEVSYQGAIRSDMIEKQFSVLYSLNRNLMLNLNSECRNNKKKKKRIAAYFFSILLSHFL